MGNTGQDATMGNQQERLYGWLAGVIDGEGTISIQCYTLPNKNVRLTPFISITNTNQKLLKRAKDVLDSMNVKSPHTIRLMYRDPGANSPCYHIRIDGYPAVLGVIEKISPFLFGKQEQAKLLREFILLRDKERIDRDSLGRLKRTGYSKKSVQILSKIRKLNGRESPETIRQAPNVEKI